MTALCAASGGDSYRRHSPQLSSSDGDAIDGDQDDSNTQFDIEMLNDNYHTAYQKGKDALMFLVLISH